MRAPTQLERELEESIAAKDADAVEFLLIVAFHFKLLHAIADPLLKLCSEGWHTRHEDVASAFQEIRDPRAVDCLYQIAITEYPYLEYDNAKALAVKCIWALGAIGSAEAAGKLKLLARSNNVIISDNAKRQLSRVENNQKAP